VLVTCLGVGVGVKSSCACLLRCIYDLGYGLYFSFVHLSFIFMCEFTLIKHLQCPLSGGDIISSLMIV
jgi:hypothetical protein